MKWWLITDFVVSLILAIPFFYIAPTIFRQYWVEKDGYVMYSHGRFFAEPIACLGKKSGMRIYGLPCKLPKYNNEYINPENFHVDLALGCCYGISNGDEAYVWMCPLDSTTYHHNASLINQKIDSIAANNKFTYGRFILPDDFSKLIYAKSHINYYNSMSSLDWYVSNCLIDFYPNRRDNSMKPDIDSVKIKYFKDRFETIMVPRDSVPSDDPIILRAFLRRKFDI